jgi:MoaA/NifB/PqqE/SkfB family radical SAM enzyme
MIKSCSEPLISISIDGKRESHEWMRGVKGSFDRVSQGVKTLVETGVHPQVIRAVAGRNRDEMADLARYSQQIGASSVRYNFMRPTARGEMMESEGATLTEREQIDLSHWVQNELQKELNSP